MLELRHVRRLAPRRAVEHDEPMTFGVATVDRGCLARFVPVHGRSIAFSRRHGNARPDIASVKWPTRGSDRRLSPCPAQRTAYATADRRVRFVDRRLALPRRAACR